MSLKEPGAEFAGLTDKIDLLGCSVNEDKSLVELFVSPVYISDDDVHGRDQILNKYHDSRTPIIF